MSEVIKAIRLSQLENELVEIRRKIAKLEGVINSPNVPQKWKRASIKLLPDLAKKRDELINEITESALLEATESNTMH